MAEDRLAELRLAESDLVDFEAAFGRLFDFDSAPAIALTGPRKIRSGKSPMADLRNFRAARRALSFPPWIASLNIFVTD